MNTSHYKKRDQKVQIGYGKTICEMTKKKSFLRPRCKIAVKNNFKHKIHFQEKYLPAMPSPRYCSEDGVEMA